MQIVFLMSHGRDIILRTMRMIKPHYVALILLTIMQCKVVIGHAETVLEAPQIAERLLVDDSSEGELVISNIDNDENIAELPNKIHHTPAKLSRWKTGPIPYQAEVQAIAKATQIDPALIHAVIATESGYNPKAQSRKGAYGLMQVLPTTAGTLTPVPIKQWSTRQQILWGSRYLKNMLNMFEGDVSLALAAYNAGPQAVKAHHNTLPPFSETRRYVPTVLGYYHVFKSRLPRETSTIDQ